MTSAWRDSRAFRSFRAVAGLATIAICLGVALAVALGSVVWVLAEAIHHAASN